MKIDNNTLILDFDDQGVVEGSNLFIGDLLRTISLGRVGKTYQREEIIDAEVKDGTLVFNTQN